MSISGLVPFSGQAAEAIVLVCGRFVNLFKNRIAAVAAIALTTIVGAVGGLVCAIQLLSLEKETIDRILLITTMLGVSFTLSVLVSKCLKLPFSPLATVGIPVGTAAIVVGWLFLKD
jgi:hypothetical protein